jgi:hypothetical protein
VMVAKLKAHTKRRVTPRITDAIRWNIQPNIPCEGAASTDGVVAVRILFPRLLTLETVVFSVISVERFSIVSSIVLKTALLDCYRPTLRGTS